LAFAQRQIRVSRAHIPPNRNRRKQIPTVIRTLGDYIQAKRYEKGLHPYQVAGKMGIETKLISAWESGTKKPDEKQWRMLSDLLSFDSGVDLPKPASRNSSRPLESPSAPRQPAIISRNFARNRRS